MRELEPIFVTDLFPTLDAKLIELLRSLREEDWRKPTLCSSWSVKDIAAHLLDGNIRKLSMYRDDFFGDKPGVINSHQELINYLNGLNADWVKAAKRVSPRILIGLLEQTGHEVYEFFKSQDPFALSLFPVAWAGEDSSANWFDVAREYTERWHHQQQIRLAVGKPGVMERMLYFPVIDAFMRALPVTYKDVEVSDGTLLKFRVTGDAGGVWYLLRTRRSWKLGKDAEGEVTAEASISQELAWRMFTKGIDKESAKQQMIVVGNEDLGSKIIDMVAVMA